MKCKHLKEVNKSYLQHCYYAFCLAFNLFLLATIAVLHGLLPWIFTNTVSDSIVKLADKLKVG